MEENKEMTQAQEAEVQDRDDAFLDGWEEDTHTGGGADQPSAANGVVEPTEAEADADAEGEEEKAGAGEADRAEDASAEHAGEKGPEGPTWEVNHLGERKTLRAGDITPELLQKGMDYDRVRQQYDDYKPVMAMVGELARQAGVSTEDYVRMVRAEAKRGQGMNADEARRAVELEDREAAVAVREAEKERADAARRDSEAAVRRNLDEFAQAFPEVFAKAREDTGAIPDSVWAEVSGGLSLTAAYAKYAVAEAQRAAETARSEARTAEQNRRNAQRSTGSMKSAGSDTKSKDPFLDGWGD